MKSVRYSKTVLKQRDWNSEEERGTQRLDTVLHASASVSYTTYTALNWTQSCFFSFFPCEGDYSRIPPKILFYFILSILRKLEHIWIRGESSIWSLKVVGWY